MSRGGALSRSLLAGLVLLVGLLECGQVYVRNALDGKAAGWSDVLQMTLPKWILLAALAPVVGMVVARFRLGRDQWQRSIPAHAAASIGFAAVHLIACVVVYGFLIEGRPNQFPARLSRLFTVYFVSDLLVYWAMVAAFSAIHYARESRDREVASSQLAARLTEARLDALRAQLNPHFLFNALNATSVMARKGERETVARMLGALAELLRATLETGGPREVSLAEEVALLDAYLEIQRARFADRLTIEKDLSEAALDTLVPSLILQPLVENAVEHGVAAHPGPGTIAIRASRRDGMLRVEVIDSGPGFAAAEGPASLGIGLSNTRDRLEQLYGSHHIFQLGNTERGGAVVVIAVPWKTTRDADSAGPRAPGREALV